MTSENDVIGKDRTDEQVAALLETSAMGAFGRSAYAAAARTFQAACQRSGVRSAMAACETLDRMA